MNRKIIGVTVGSPLPKPNLMQTDPNKGDFVKGKSILPTKVSQLENDSGYLKETKLNESINVALAQAKKSGEFDGADGKTAYQYAQESGYTGTEEEFAAKLAATDSDTELVLSDNLFDKSTATSGGVFYYSSNGLRVENTTWSYYAYVPLRGAGTYRTKWNNNQHSSTTSRVGITKEDNSWLQTINGTLTATDNAEAYDMEFVVTQAMINNGAAKIAFDCSPNILDTVMIVKDRDYPEEYIPYGYIEVSTDNGKKLDNVLLEKTAVFLGDSICAGTESIPSDSGFYNYGWGGIIGENNRMTWKNYGKNGGTVTSLASVQSTRWLTSQADSAIAEYPNADYVIFEGGCNDADQMKDAGLGVISSDYATFDTTTFSGAFEALVLKLVTAYPNAKIGYIIPQKMYTQNDHTASGHVHRRFFDRAVEICDKWGIPVIDLWRGSSLNPKLPNASTFYVDGQHLTVAGYQKLAPMIEAWMRDMYTQGVASSGSTGGVSSWNDLTDKPFDIVEVLPETQFVYNESMGYFVAETGFMLVPGRKYIVNWNGVEYTTTARYGTLAIGESTAAVLFVGNPVLITGEDNGLPFGIANVILVGGMIGAIPMDGSTSVTVSIKSSTFYETSDTLLLSANYDSQLKKVAAVYATPEQIEQAFFAGKRIMALTYGLGIVQMVLTHYLIDGLIAFHVPTITGVEFYQMKYNNDGTYVPYSD